MSLIKDFLQGRWLGHPLHPALVHVPVGLWPAALVFDLLSRAWPGAAFVSAGFCCILVGSAVAVLAVPAGLADWSEIKPEKRAWKIGVAHMLLNVAALTLFILSLILRLREGIARESVGNWPLAWCAAGTALVIVSAYLGGQMAHEHGVGVGRMSKKKWRAIAEAGGANLPSE